VANAFAFEVFERIARLAHRVTDREPTDQPVLHPFDVRNIHPKLPAKVRKLFDDGHYSDATFNAFKYLDKAVSKHSGIKESGHNLMMAAFAGEKPGDPKIQLTPLKEISEVDEQKGFRFVFAGGVWAIRNPRGHEYAISDDVDTCLDHLSFVSMLLRRLESAGYV
jgi:uncharacterized protein (TIGR02391 family)